MARPRDGVPGGMESGFYPTPKVHPLPGGSYTGKAGIFPALPRPTLGVEKLTRFLNTDPGADKPGPMFSQATIQNAIDGCLSRIPSDKKALVLDVNIDGEGVRAVAAFQTGTGWELGVVGEIERDKDWMVGFRVAKVFG